ncbi:N-6 DNA methylase [Erysipelothrix rhusiopathiae]|nr:N-6 DNA methylase [Erysipelothrix rhusiopathiae]
MNKKKHVAIDFKNFLEKVVNYIAKKESKKNKFSVKHIYMNLNYVLIAYLNYYKYINQKGFDDSLINLLELEMISEKQYSFFLCYDKYINEEFRNSNILKNIEITEIGYIHEYMLGFKAVVSNDNHIEILANKNNRDLSGSYYTPENLSQEMVNYLSTKSSFEGKKIIDLSCGKGDFYISIINYLKKENMEFRIKNVVQEMYGIDIDPIALLCCISTLSFESQISFAEIKKNFVLGNALIDNNKVLTFDEKFKIYTNEEYYRLDFGVSYTDLLSNKFDFIFGNPPWEKIRFEEKKFFEHRCPEIYNTTKKSEREKLINSLELTNIELYHEYLTLKKQYDLFKDYIKKSPYFTKSSFGELNTYMLFTELSFSILSDYGYVSLILKNGIVSSPNSSNFFNFLLNEYEILSIILYSNKEKIFNIDSREKFCIITGKKGKTKDFELSFNNQVIQRLSELEYLKIDRQMLQKINPQTGLLPNVKNTEEFMWLYDLHLKNPKFYEIFDSVKYGRLVHYTSHSRYISTSKKDANIGVLDGRMVNQYSHTRDFKYFIELEKWEDIKRNYKNDYSLVWRSLTSATNTRTVIATCVKNQPSSQSLQLLQTDDYNDLLFLVGLFNTDIFDAIVRSKLSGIDLTQSIIKQVPVPSREKLEENIIVNGEASSVYREVIDRVKILLDINDFQGNNKVSQKLMSEINELILMCYNFSF